jgi:DNA ligase-1
MILYKKDSKNKVRTLEIYSSGSNIIQVSGLLDGKKVAKESNCIGKNIGKANETTPEDQAILETDAKITLKLREGYVKTIAELEQELILPMLAKSYEKEYRKIDWSTAYVQPKLDGMRCLDLLSGKISRKNKPITTLDHIKVVRPGNMVTPVDGEAYAHGLSFQENMKLIKKYRPGQTEKVQFHVYDTVSELSFIDRLLLLNVIAAESENVQLVPTYKVHSVEDVKKYHAEFLSQGYEGTMIRWGTEGYKVNGRSSNLLKYKDFLDLSCTVVDVIPSEKSPEQGVVHCIHNNKTFGCGMKFSHSNREEILTNKKKYIGQKAELRFFEFTDGGIPRFPVCVGFRLDK